LDESDEKNEIFERFFQSRPNVTHSTANTIRSSFVKALLSYCTKLEYLDIGHCLHVNIGAFGGMPVKHT
jgi:hypothetical protein